MKKQKIRNTCLLILTAFIWGVAFVAQSTGGDAVGPYTFNVSRMLLGGCALLPVIYWMDRHKPSERKPVTKEQKKDLWKGGIVCGIILCVSSNFQQQGITMGTPAGKAGFLTACYILLVPILGIFLRKRCRWNVWVGVLLALAGLYLLCVKGTFALQLSDGLVLLCALCFSAHILTVDHFAPKVDGVRMACIQFFVCALIGAVPMALTEMGHTGEELKAWLSGFAASGAWISILYAGLLSSGVGYTLQIIGQEGLNPTIASLLMSLESMFSVIAGWLILKETMDVRELIGCALIFIAIVLAQIEFGKKKLPESGMEQVLPKTDIMK